jgi:hypothetical protein
VWDEPSLKVWWLTGRDTTKNDQHLCPAWMTSAECRKGESRKKGSRTLNFSVESSALEMLGSGSGRAGISN